VQNIKLNLKMHGGRNKTKLCIVKPNYNFENDSLKSSAVLVQYKKCKWFP
jgi:hypothetical protein